MLYIVNSFTNQSYSFITNVKRSSLIQEVVRRLRNTKRSLPWKMKTEILSEFVNSMKLSGYSKEYRLDIIQSGIRVFEKICERNDSGETPLLLKNVLFADYDEDLL